MSSGTWLNKDGLYLQFGTAKATPEVAGEYLSEYDGSRIIQADIDLTTISSTPLIVSNTTLWPATPTGVAEKFFVEQVEVITIVGATGASGVNVGLTSAADRTTALSNTAFVNNLLVTNIATTGNKVVLWKNSTVTGAGAYVPTPGNNTVDGYISASCESGGTFSAGQLRVRIKYWEYGTIYR